MELKEFIKTAIADITNAVKELQGGLDNGAVINPTLPIGENGKTVLVDNEVRVIERLNFDVAVSASESSTVEGNAKAGISVFGGKVGADTSSRSENVSRLTFSIPVVFPSTHVKTQTEVMRDRRATRLPVQTASSSQSQ